MERNSKFNPNNLSEPEKEVLLFQNKIIGSFVKNRYKINPFAISRDNRGNIIILANKLSPQNRDYDINCISAYTLGINALENHINLFNVGYLLYYFAKDYPNINLKEKSKQPINELFINLLAVHGAFNNQGIAKLMMQAAENLCVINNLEFMALKSTKTFVPKNSNPESYEDYFDVNHYFYHNLGFRKDENDDSYNSILKPLKKSKLERKQLSFGLSPIQDKANINSEIFSLKHEPDIVKQNIDDFMLKNVFPNGYNIINSQNFSPIKLETNVDSIKALIALLSCLPKDPIQTEKEKLLNLIAVEENQNKSTQNETQNNLCLTPEFSEAVQKIVENNEEFINRILHLYKLKNQPHNEPNQNL